MQKEAPLELEEILAASDGSIGKALTLLDSSKREPLLKKRKLAREFIDLLLDKRNSLAALRLIKVLGEKRDELISELQMIRLALRDLLVLKQNENAVLCFFPNREEALNLSDSFTTPKLLKLCNELDLACEKLRINANIRLTLTALAVGTGLLQ